MQMGEMNLLKENLVDVERAWRRNDTLAVYEAYRNLAVHFATTNKPKRSVSFFLKCLEMAASCDYYEGELRANLNLGLAYESMQDTQNAIQYHEAHMEMALSSENQVEASKAYSNLIRVYQRFADELEAQGEHELALEQLQLCLEAAQGLGNNLAEGDLAVVNKGLAEDMQQLNDAHHDCMEKAQAYETETKARAEELKALAEAKKIIIETPGGATEQTYGLIDASFVQMSATSRLSTRADLANFEAAKFVKRLARQLHSTALAQLAAQMSAAARFSVASGEDPFAKVKGLIQDMIEKLLKEAEEEAAKKGYCDKEMGETKAKRKELNTEIEELTTQIDEKTADSAKLKEEVAVLSKELAELAKLQQEMDKIRAEEKAAYDKNKAEMEQGVEGVKLALKVLREYYASGAGAQGAGGGIISMLEVIEADFEKGLAEIIATEEAAVAEYEKISKENEISKTTKEQDVKYKGKEAKSLDESVAELTSDKAG